MACFKVQDHRSTGDSDYCMVRTLQCMDVLGQQIMNEYDCPLLSMTNLLYCIPSTSVSHAVSVAHECTDSCLFVNSSVEVPFRRVEHESVESSFPLFKHDFSSKMYRRNVYCIAV